MGISVKVQENGARSEMRLRERGVKAKGVETVERHGASGLFLVPVREGES